MQASPLAHHSLTENSTIEDEVVQAIAHDPAKSPSTEKIQAVSDAPSFTAI